MYGSMAYSKMAPETYLLSLVKIKKLISKFVWKSTHLYCPKMAHSPIIFVLNEVYRSSFKNLYYTLVFDQLGIMSPGQMFPGQI